MQPERRQIIKLGEPGMRAALVKYAGSVELKTELSSHIKPVDIITKTKHGETLSQEEIFGWVNGITSGKVKDYQTSAWLMAVCLRQPPLSKDETVDLTLAMAASGKVLNLDVNEYHVAPQVLPKEGGIAYHEWFIEFSTEPTKVAEFAEVLDQQLQGKNSYYKDLRKGEMLDIIKITPIKIGGFNAYMKASGKLGGQNKLPRLANDRQLAEELAKFII